MNENEKAAVAAGLWELGQNKVRGYEPAPDMHDPANLWRALENVATRKTCAIQINTVYGSDRWVASLFKEIGGVLEPAPFFGDGSIASVIFAALVALYNAEHPA